MVMEMKMMLVMVMTMFMMVDEDGGCNDGGQPNFLPEKVKDSEARLSPPSSHPRKYYYDGGGDVDKGRQKSLKKKVVKKVVSKSQNINRTLVNQESIISLVVVMLTKVVKKSIKKVVKKVVSKPQNINRPQICIT